MKAFSVTVKTASGRFDYEAIAVAAADVYPDAYNRFGVCGVSVRPKVIA